VKRLLFLAILAASCRSASDRLPAIAGAQPPLAPMASPTPPPGKDPLAVTKAPEEVVVAAWAEPSHLPPGGGVVQILVRTRRRGGSPFAGVEVRLRADEGALYSAGRTLVTDRSGMTRDQLTARRTAEITLNAGGTRYRFNVPVLPESTE
jgi:hypothetical protein